MTGQIDYQTLAQHHIGNLDVLPEQYANCRLGFRRTGAMILNFIETNLGWEERLATLRHFQLNEAIFASPNQTISFNFGTDLIEYLVRYKINKSTLPMIGLQSFLDNCPNAVKDEIAECNDVAEIYERFCDHLIEKHFEKNFHYQIQNLNDQKCTVIAKPNQQLVETLKNKTPGSQNTALYRIGIASIYPCILGLPPSITKQTASIYKGDPFIRYEISFEKAQWVLSHSKADSPSNRSRLLN